ncbi:MAG: type II toxin-antitoxin system PemK/MazF family toxin [Thermosipho sp. (in: Bacteria)]|nr:type II toxin-antitoxin system PemK/MazF family toxin [Thermosipho sp. (in: thermotogales)]
MSFKKVKRGEVYLARVGNKYVGSEQKGTRPVLIIQNNIGNRFSPTVIVAFITSKLHKKKLPTHCLVNLKVPSIVLTEQLRTIDKTRLVERMGRLTEEEMQKVEKCLRISLDLGGDGGD